MKLGQTVLYTYGEDDGCKPDKVGQQRPATVVRDWGTVANVKVHTDFTNDFEGGLPGSDGTLWRTSRSFADEPVPGGLSPLPGEDPLVPVAPANYLSGGSASMLSPPVNAAPSEPPPEA